MNDNNPQVKLHLSVLIFSPAKTAAGPHRLCIVQSSYFWFFQKRVKRCFAAVGQWRQAPLPFAPTPHPLSPCFHWSALSLRMFVHKCGFEVLKKQKVMCQGLSVVCLIRRLYIKVNILVVSIACGVELHICSLSLCVHVCESVCMCVRACARLPTCVYLLDKMRVFFFF